LRKKRASTREPNNDYGVNLGDHNRCNNTALRKATRRVSQLHNTVLAPSGLLTKDTVARPGNTVDEANGNKIT
jgi:hypothetical protein